MPGLGNGSGCAGSIRAGLAREHLQPDRVMVKEVVSVDGDDFALGGQEVDTGPSRGSGIEVVLIKERDNRDAEQVLIADLRGVKFGKEVHHRTECLRVFEPTPIGGSFVRNPEEISGNGRGFSSVL